MITYWFIKVAGDEWNRTESPEYVGINNYFPWNIRLTDYLNGKDITPYNDYFDLGELHPRQYIKPNITGVDKPEAEIKTIFRDEVDPSKNNVMLFTTYWPSWPDNKGFFLECLPVEILNWLNENPQVRILFMRPTECDYYKEPLNKLGEDYSKMRGKYGLKNEILIMTCMNNGRDYYSQFKHPDFIQNVGSLHYIQHRLDSHAKRHEIEELALASKNPTSFSKKVLLYTHRFRSARLLLLRLVLNTVPIKDLRYSFSNAMEDDQIEFLIKEYEKEKVFNREEANDIRNIVKIRPQGNVFKIGNHPAYIKEGDTPARISTHLPHKEDYQDVFLELVSESIGEREFDREWEHGNPSTIQKVFITEKIFKPIIARRPFIVAANANYLKTLKELGFKTFNKWWDESYDSDDLNLKESLEIINRNLIFINSKSETQLLGIYEDMKPILEHNYKRMIEFMYEDTRYNNKELEKYFNNAKRN